MKLKLYRYSQEYIDLCEWSGYHDFIADKIDKVYTCLGEFAHAPGHVLMVEFGTWEPLPGMPDLANFVELDHHPDDVTFEINVED